MAVRAQKLKFTFPTNSKNIYIEEECQWGALVLNIRGVDLSQGNNLNEKN